MSNSKVSQYPGKQVTVRWDGRLCIHVAECGKSEGDLFVGGRDPWCDPDQADTAKVREICSRCPSGALSVHDTSDELLETAPSENQVRVMFNGPLYLRGDLTIEGAPDDMPGTRFRAALCRCGQSANKPFCDNSHLKAMFEDAGAIGRSGPGTDQTGGKLSIKPSTNGPLLLNGNVVLVTAGGRIAWRGDKVALCRCGASKNKPFCDGSHSATGFTSA